ncbi:g_PROTEIN_RECEP_F2_4 domain-containing protein [Trichonephila inaurata madagascariensis]|nr:g_PROTEIN_RECEP_F2_4 domain-containing protein [Trichonephila inaurata madagascariensis]
MNTAENKADLWLRFLVCIRLSVVMGLTWIFGALSSAVEANWLWHLSVICNVLQGVFIFFSFTFTEKTRLECKKAIARKKSSFSPTQVSCQQSTSV